jgi:hypothetical protein
MVKILLTSSKPEAWVIICVHCIGTHSGRQQPHSLWSLAKDFLHSCPRNKYLPWIVVCCNVMSCSLLRVSWCLERTCCLHLQGRSIIFYFGVLKLFMPEYKDWFLSAKYHVVGAFWRWWGKTPHVVNITNWWLGISLSALHLEKGL